MSPESEVVVDGNTDTQSRTNRPSFGPRSPAHCNPAQATRLPCCPVICTAEGCHGQILLARASRWHATPHATGRTGCQPRFLSDAEKLGLRQSARPVRDGSDYVL